MNIKPVLTQIAIVIGILFLIMNSLEAQEKGRTYTPDWESIDSRQIPAWFQDDKFGLLICWGPYSVPSWRKLSTRRYASYAEWYYAAVMDDEKNGGKQFHIDNYGEDFEYRDFGPLFRAELFDPAFWARTFKASGAKYVVLTAKYHDGFCMWPTENKYKKDWNAGNIGPKRDLLGELTDAVRAQNMRMGIYYSIPDWESVPMTKDKSVYRINKKYVDKWGHDPEFYRDEIYKPDLMELVTKYKPSLIFSDAGEWTYEEDFWGTLDFLSWLYSESPVKDEVVVNDRFCKGMPGKHGDYYSSEYQDADERVGVSHPWEESRGMGGSYGYNRAENLEDYRTSEELIHEFIGIISRDGNFLLNVGPTADGRIPVYQQKILADIGDWLEINGEAVYQTRSWKGSKNNLDENLFFTRKGNVVYAFCTKWPSGGLNIMMGHEKSKDVQLFGYTNKLSFIQEDDLLSIQEPIVSPANQDLNYAYVFKILLY